MALYITATYQIKEDSIKKMKKAIEDFTAYVKKNEPATKLYMSWQDQKDPTKFKHFFIFENEDAQVTHSNSEAVKKFEKIYTPLLTHDPVIFTHYDNVASNS